jgi:O-antigen ligase
VIFDEVASFPELELVPVFINSPAWARSSDSVTAPPDSPSDYADFVSQFAERYGNSVDHYQIWDEPNLSAAWGNADPRPAEYAALLSEAYTAIHAADAQASVITAALAPTTERTGRNIADVLYLEDLYELGVQNYFDAAAGKPYGFSTSPQNRTVSLGTLNFSRLVLLREVMVAHDDGQKPVWGAGFGWNSLPDGWSGGSSIWGSVTAQQQHEYTIQAFQRAHREWPWAGGLILQHWQPDTSPDDPLQGFAVINHQNQPTALWQTLVNNPPPALPANGLYHPRTEAASYSGLWTFGALGADIGWLPTSDSQLTFDFIGIDIALLLREGDYFAFLYPRIDDKQANATPRDADGNAYILLRSASAEPEVNLVEVANSLQPGTHTLQVVADRGWDRWALAGYAVSDGNLAAPYNQQITLATLTAIIALAVVIAAGLRLPWSNWWQHAQSLVRPLSHITHLLLSILASCVLMTGLLLTWGDSLPAIFRRDAFQFGASLFITGGIIAYELPFLVSVVAVGVLFVLIYQRIETGLMLVVLWTPFFLFPVELYTFFFPMAELLLLITVAAAILCGLVRWARQRQSTTAMFPADYTLSLSTIDKVMLAWAGLASVAVLWSEYTSVAVSEWRTLFIEPFLFYILLRVTTLSKQGWLRLFNMLIIAGSLVALIGLLQYIRGEAIITAEAGVRRLAGVYGSPNNVALFLGRTIPFALAYLLMSETYYRRIFGGISLAIMLIALALTQSTGGLLLGIPAGVAVVFLIHWRWRAVPVLAGLAIAGAVAIVALTQISPRFASLLDWTQGTNFMRIRIWESSLSIIRDYPLTGLGLDQFLYAFRGHYIRPDAIFDPDLSHPHNIVFDFWIRLGMGGVLLLIAIQISFWRKIYHAITDNLSSGWQLIVTGLAGAMAALLAHGLIDNSIYVFDLAYIFALLMAATQSIPAVYNK